MKKDWNEGIPGAPRAGDVADSQSSAVDMATVFDGSRAVGSMHADKLRGGLDTFDELLPGFLRQAFALGLEAIVFDQPDSMVGHRKDLLIFNRGRVQAVLNAMGIAETVDKFLTRSLEEIFKLGSFERYAIDELYGECSQPLRIETLIDRTRSVIAAQIANAKSPAVLWSSGEDSQLLLWLVRQFQRDVPVIHFRSLPSETKHVFADEVISTWGLRVSDLPLIGVDVVARGSEVNIIEEFAVSPEFSLYLPMENEPGRAIDSESACGVEVINEKQKKIRKPESRIHDVVFIGHHQGDGDPVLGELKPKEFVAQAADVVMVYALRDWEKADVREASRRLGIPQNLERYRGNMTANSDYFPLCTECLKPGRTEDELSCPKSGNPVYNLGKLIEPEARREGWRQRFINIEA